MNSQKINEFLAAISKRNDVVLACFLVAIIFMMVLPMPTFLVDILIGLNMSISVVLLMLSVYIRSPLEFTSFPAVLLATTLFRLALSITTTRLILLQADAGEIVYTFGNFVVGGNLVVGGVIFLILTIVQFIVITKGSERIAEVSARFSLDAMPGKQMSIDGDMRAGVIDMHEAQRRRSDVERESQLYGSMDGAMKFVKGDAIASLIIIVVNILGGVTIGIMQKGMTASEAMSLYSILTIGDGLVAQIPALFISITAGFIVTRVSSETSENLGTDIGDQLVGHPRALMIGGVLLLGFAIIPGFPTITFLGLAAIFGGAGFFLSRRDKLNAANATNNSFPAGSPAAHSKTSKKQTSQQNHEEFLLTAPLMVDVSSKCKDTLELGDLNEELAKVRHALYMDLGIPFPGVHLRYNDSLKDGSYTILLNEVPVGEGEFPVSHVMVREDPEQLEILSIPYEVKQDNFPGNPLWVEKQYLQSLEEAEIKFMSGTRALCFHLSYILKRYAEDFIGIQETRYLLEKMEPNFGELVKEVQRLLPLQKITDIFQRLVSEDISIRNLRTILEALVEWGQKEKDTVILAEYVRGSLNRHISYKYSNGQNMLPAYLLEQDVEEVIRSGIRQTSAGAYLALDPKATKSFISSVKAEIGDITRMQHKPVLIVSMDIRRYVRKLIELEIYDLSVLSFQELTREINIQPLGRVAI